MRLERNQERERGTFNGGDIKKKKKRNCEAKKEHI